MSSAVMKFNPREEKNFITLADIFPIPHALMGKLSLRLTRPTKKPTTNMGAGFFKFFGVADGARTHDNRNHNPGLYQLSYSHREPVIIAFVLPYSVMFCGSSAFADGRGALIATLKRWLSIL